MLPCNRHRNIRSSEQSFHQACMTNPKRCEGGQQGKTPTLGPGSPFSPGIPGLPDSPCREQKNDVDNAEFCTFVY